MKKKILLMLLIIGASTLGNMTLSKSGREFILAKEGFETKSYKCQAGIWTIGYGTTRINGKPVTEGMVITPERATELFQKQIQVYKRGVLDNVTRELNQNQFDAYVSLTYNIGVGAFKKSKTLSSFNKGRYIDAAEEIKNWRIADGKVSRGLVKRRAEEVSVFTSEVK